MLIPKDWADYSQEVHLREPSNLCPALPASCSREGLLSPTLSAPLCDVEQWMACEGEAIWARVNDKSTLRACNKHAHDWSECIWHPAWMVGCRWHAILCDEGPDTPEATLPFRCSYPPIAAMTEQGLRQEFRRREPFWSYEARAAEMLSTIDLLRERLNKVSALATQLVQTCGSHGSYSALASSMATEKLVELLNIRKLTSQELLDMSIACSEERIAALANESAETEDSPISSPPPSS